MGEERFAGAKGTDCMEDWGDKQAWGLIIHRHVIAALLSHSCGCFAGEGSFLLQSELLIFHTKAHYLRFIANLWLPTFHLPFYALFSNESPSYIILNDT